MYYFGNVAEFFLNSSITNLLSVSVDARDKLLLLKPLLLAFSTSHLLYSQSPDPVWILFAKLLVFFQLL